jgi:hypothetical protein
MQTTIAGMDGEASPTMLVRLLEPHTPAFPYRPEPGPSVPVVHPAKSLAAHPGPEPAEGPPSDSDSSDDECPPPSDDPSPTG